MLTAEKKGFIKIEISMPWGKAIQKNEILNTLKQRYQMIDINETDAEKHKILE